MDVWPSKREFVTPDWYYANSRKNATVATLTDDGQKIEGNLPGVPFPIPQTGLEVIWNHMIRYATDHTAEFDTYYVGSTGKPVLSTSGQFNNVFKIFDDPEKEVGDTSWLKLRINYSAPARRAGEILLVHEPGADYTAGKGRKAWQYLVGQRRVRRILRYAQPRCGGHIDLRRFLPLQRITRALPVRRPTFAGY